MWGIAKYCQCLPNLPSPLHISAGEPFLVFFHCVDKYQIMVFRIMIVDPSVALIEQDLFFRHDHDELVILHASIHDAGIIFCF